MSQITVGLTADARAHVARQARANGIGGSAYIRRLVLQDMQAHPTSGEPIEPVQPVSHGPGIAGTLSGEVLASLFAGGLTQEQARVLLELYVAGQHP